MTCPTTPENGSPGCKGEITVRLTGGAKFEETGLDQQTFPFEVNHNIDTNQCNQQFPRINKVLDQKVIGKIVQGGCTDPWSDQDPVLSAAVRNDLNEENPSATYIESTDPWVATALCAANPSNGFPTGACSNDGGAWITVGNPDPEEGGPERLINAEVCAASAKDLTCGDQITSVDKQQVQPGPAPKECKLDNAGNCTCRCARCNKAGTLVNLGGGTSATFVLADPKGVSGFENRPWAAICAVTVTGN